MVNILKHIHMLWQTYVYIRVCMCILEYAGVLSGFIKIITKYLKILFCPP